MTGFAEATMGVILRVEGLRLPIGGVRPPGQASFCDRAGEVTANIGPSGANKTSLHDAILGFCEPPASHARFEGRGIATLPAHPRATI